MHDNILEAKECARRARIEWNSCDQTKVHRVARRFFGDAVLCLMISQFCDTDRPLASFPQLFVLVLAYCSISLVEREIEGEHAKIQHAVKLGAATPATVCSRIRAPYLLELLDSSQFVAWCRSVWSQHILRSVLKVVYTGEQLKGLGVSDLLKKIYLYGIAEQFVDVTQTKDALQVWDAALWHVLKPLPLASSATETFALDWIRHRLQPGRLFCLPSHLCRLVDYASYTAHESGACSIRDIMDLVCCEDVVRDTLDHANHNFFKVVNCYPSRRVLEHPWHLGARPSVISVVIYQVGKGTGGTKIRLHANAASTYLDLKFLISDAFPEVLQSLWSFGSIEFGTKLVIKDMYLRTLGNVPISMPALAERSEALANAESFQLLAPRSTPAYKLLLHILRKIAFVESDNFVEAFLQA